MKEMMRDRNLILSWSVSDDSLVFQLTCQTTGYVGLVFSLTDQPQSGFIAGVTNTGQYHRYLSLEGIGKILQSNISRPTLPIDGIIALPW